jgi:hypothetical protein
METVTLERARNLSFTVPGKLLSLDNPKILKGTGSGFLTAILHLSPARSSGFQVCPNASDGCTDGCLAYSGRGRFDNVRNARINKTRYFFGNRAGFVAQLVREIEQLGRMAERNGERLAIRLNGTSDIRWESVKMPGFANLMERFPDTIFYDYSKIPNRRNIPGNYSLTFSRSESNERDALRELERGRNVAAVFLERPDEWNGFPVIDGDVNDLRFLDPNPVVVGLRAKGPARKDTTGFVIRP